MQNAFHILLVDDDDIDREIISRLLNQLDRPVTLAEADSMAKARRLLKDTHFDCVLLDYRLSDGCGLALVTDIRAHRSEACSVILLTGMESENLIADSVRKGVTNYLAKAHLSLKTLSDIIDGNIGRAGAEQRIHEIEARHADRRQKEYEQLRQIVENVADSIYTTDEVGTIESFNPACEHLFGYRAAEVIGQQVELLCPLAAGDTEKFKREVLTALGATKEALGRRKDGSTFPVEFAITPIQLTGKNLFCATVRDLSARKEAEAAKNNFIATVNHELRTPLMSIRTSLEMLERETAGILDDEMGHLLDISLRNCERLGRLVDEFLDSQAINAGKLSVSPRSTEVTALVRDVVERHREYGRRFGIVLTQNIPDAQIDCNVDPERLSQALGNLISNAVKFSPKGESVVIGLTSREPDLVDIYVKDRGPGIPHEFRAKIFGQFAQADNDTTRARNGSGLGLNIAKHLIEAMGGSVGFETAEGAGSTFYFHLPLYAGEKSCKAA
jgi:PAS domain S-box-containing protein